MNWTVSSRLLELRDLTVDFDLPSGRSFRAVDSVSLGFSEGSSFGIIGESGSGKSTTILAAMGLLPHTATVSGHVLYEGIDILAGGERSIARHRWHDVSMAFQGSMSAFNPVRTIGAQLLEVIAVHRVDTEGPEGAYVENLLSDVGLPREIVKGYPHELSGGMKQRAMIAMSLVCRPKILLADEPTTALDVIVQAQILRLLGRLSADRGLALVMVSHDIGVIAELCSEAAVMHDGRVIDAGTVDFLCHNSNSEYTQLLFSSSPPLDRRHRATGGLRAAPGSRASGRERR